MSLPGRRVGGTWYGQRLILFGFLSQSSKTKTVAVMGSVPQWLAGDQDGVGAQRGDLAGFRVLFYDSLNARADELFELADALLCADGPVRSLVELSLAGKHRRGHGGFSMTPSRFALVSRSRVPPAPAPRSAPQPTRKSWAKCSILWS